MSEFVPRKEYSLLKSTIIVYKSEIFNVNFNISLISILIQR